MKVLVTGANGFVGSHIVEALVESGHSVVCLVRSTSSLQWLKGLNVEQCVGDICTKESLADAVKGVDAIIHSAGVLRALDEDTYYRVNQFGTRNLLEAVASCNPGLKKFVYISSQAAMGPSSELRQKLLNEPENPVSDYGKSKLAGEKEVKAFKGRIPFTILRPASVYGPRDKDIFIFFQLVHRGLRPRTTSKRYIQMVFVKDLARAAVQALSAGNNNTYFLAEDTFYTWEDIARSIASVTGKNTFPLPLPDLAFYGTSFLAEKLSLLTGKPAVLNSQKIAEMMQRYWLGDPVPAQKDLGMGFTKLEIGAKITYSWYRTNKWL